MQAALDVVAYDKTLTEPDMLALLRARHDRPGNGANGEYAFATHVRNAAGFNAHRAFDAVALALWPSRHLELTIFEVKVSRSDWLRELKANPTGGTDPLEKAHAALNLADRFVVVAPAGMVKVDELPARWGLLELTRKRAFRMTVEPTLLRPRDRFFAPLPRGFVVALLRSIPGAVPGDTRRVTRAVDPAVWHGHVFA